MVYNPLEMAVHRPAGEGGVARLYGGADLEVVLVAALKLFEGSGIVLTESGPVGPGEGEERPPDEADEQAVARCFGQGQMKPEVGQLKLGGGPTAPRPTLSAGPAPPGPPSGWSAAAGPTGLRRADGCRG